MSFDGVMDLVVGYLGTGWAIAERWLLSPAAWSQLGLIVVSWILAVLVNRIVSPRLELVLRPAADIETVLDKARRFLLLFLPLLLPLMAYVFTALGEQVTRSLFGSGTVIAFGKRLFLLVAARILVRDILKEPFLRFLGRWALLPIVGLYTVGLLVPIQDALTNTVISLGNISFSVMSLVRGVLAGGFLFWLGSWTNRQSADYIGKQPLRPAIRQLTIKSAEIAIFGIAFLLLMNIMGISLTSLAVLGGAIGVGLGFGLQKIASNFISGVILLVEGQATVGDFVELNGGEAGTIIKMTARATILETFDGKWIVVPNEDFITTRVVNYSDAGSAKRYEAEFSVSYETDINKVPMVINAAVAQLPFVLTQPDGPDCELAGFGDSGIDFVCEYWVEGIDDGKNKYRSHVLFAIWNALKDAGIDIPYPHRVIEMKGGALPVSVG